MIELSVDAGKVQSLADFSSLVLAELASMERIGEKSAVNLINVLEKVKTMILTRLVCLLGICYVNDDVAAGLDNHFLPW